MLLFSLDCFTTPEQYLIILSVKEVSRTIFWVFGRLNPDLLGQFLDAIGKKIRFILLDRLDKIKGDFFFQMNTHIYIQSSGKIHSCGSVITAVWLLHMDVNKTHGEKLDGNYTRMLRPESNTQLYGHLSPIWKTIQVRPTRHAGQNHKQCSSVGNLLSFLLRCSTRPYERGTQWDSNSLV